MVAKKIPITDTNIVFNTPIKNIVAQESVESKSIKDINTSKPAEEFKKSKPLLIPCTECKEIYDNREFNSKFNLHVNEIPNNNKYLRYNLGICGFCKRTRLCKKHLKRAYYYGLFYRKVYSPMCNSCCWFEVD